MKLNQVPLVLTAAGVTQPIPTDSRSLGGSGVAISVVQAGVGPNTWQVQYTLDDVFAPGYVAANGNWNTPQANQFTGTLNASANVAPGGFFGSFTGYATAIRLNASILTVGSLSLQAWQADSTQGA